MITVYSFYFYDDYIYRPNYDKLDKASNMCDELLKYDLIHEYHMDVFMPVWVLDVNFNYIKRIKRYFNRKGFYCEYGAYPFELRVHCLYYKKDLYAIKKYEEWVYGKELKPYRYWENE